MNKHLQNIKEKLYYIKRQSKAERLKSGKYTVLLEGDIAGVFMHEAFGHTAESDHYYSNSPLLKNKKIKKGISIAPKYIDVIDFAKEGERGHTPFSDFGIKRKKVDIVKEGSRHKLET